MFLYDMDFQNKVEDPEIGIENDLRVYVYLIFEDDPHNVPMNLNDISPVYDVLMLQDL